jgi:hypothetical protein
VSAMGTVTANVSLAPIGGGPGEGVLPQAQSLERKRQLRHQLQSIALVESPPHPGPLPRKGRGKSFEAFNLRSHVTGGITQ